VPTPSDDPDLREDEEPLEGDELFDDAPAGELEGEGDADPDAPPSPN
jgi:segregation and condensation protein B